MIGVPLRSLCPLALGLVALCGLALATGCSTSPNPSFCCTDPADCARFGVDEPERACGDGLACIGNTCIAMSCETDGCTTTTAPVCDTATDVCTGCASSADCAAFADAPVCDTATGACIACVDAACPSGACADDGTCADEASVVYVDPQGQDAIPCSRAQPCFNLAFAAKQTNGARTHIVIAPGSYTLPGAPVSISSQTTTAPRITIHGGGATLTGGSGDGFILTLIPVTLRDLELVNPTPTEGYVINASASTGLERVRLRGYAGIATGAPLRLVDVDIRATTLGIRNLGALTIDRATISGGTIGLHSLTGMVDLTNLLVFGTSGLGIDLESTNGSIAFSTIANTGTNIANMPGLRCSSATVTVRSTIVWSPGTSSYPGITGPCNLVSSIVGPIAVAGAMSTDPVFVDQQTNDYRLSGGSPAKDAVNTGPIHDFEGDPRPRGLRFDIGADEAP